MIIWIGIFFRRRFREYGGFIVRVYFDGQLQDERARPPELLTLFPAPDQIAPSPGMAP